MTNELVKILEAAQYYYDRSMKYFSYFEETQNEDYWNWSKENDCKCVAMLEAYGIIAGTHIMKHEIKKEIDMLKKKQPISEALADMIDEYEELGIACLL